MSATKRNYKNFVDYIPNIQNETIRNFVDNYVIYVRDVKKLKKWKDEIQFAPSIFGSLNIDDNLWHNIRIQITDTDKYMKRRKKLLNFMIAFSETVKEEFLNKQFFISIKNKNLLKESIDYIYQHDDLTNFKPFKNEQSAINCSTSKNTYFYDMDDSFFEGWHDDIKHSFIQFYTKNLVSYYGKDFIKEQFKNFKGLSLEEITFDKIRQIRTKENAKLLMRFVLKLYDNGLLNSENEFSKLFQNNPKIISTIRTGNGFNYDRFFKLEDLTSTITINKHNDKIYLIDQENILSKYIYEFGKEFKYDGLREQDFYISIKEVANEQNITFEDEQDFNEFKFNKLFNSYTNDRYHLLTLFIFIMSKLTEKQLEENFTIFTPEIYASIRNTYKLKELQITNEMIVNLSTDEKFDLTKNQFLVNSGITKKSTRRRLFFYTDFEKIINKDFREQYKKYFLVDLIRQNPSRIDNSFYANVKFLNYLTSRNVVELNTPKINELVKQFISDTLNDAKDKYKTLYAIRNFLSTIVTDNSFLKGLFRPRRKQRPSRPQISHNADIQLLTQNLLLKTSKTDSLYDFYAYIISQIILIKPLRVGSLLGLSTTDVDVTERRMRYDDKASITGGSWQYMPERIADLIGLVLERTKELREKYKHFKEKSKYLFIVENNGTIEVVSESTINNKLEGLTTTNLRKYAISNLLTNKEQEMTLISYTDHSPSSSVVYDHYVGTTDEERNVVFVGTIGDVDDDGNVIIDNDGSTGELKLLSRCECCKKYQFTDMEYVKKMIIDYKEMKEKCRNETNQINEKVIRYIDEALKMLERGLYEKKSKDYGDA